MNKRNYSLELEKLITKLKATNQVPHLLLHACCAPCSSYVLEYLSLYFKITLFYYNPNIAPKEEYLHRVQEIRRFISELKTVNPVTFLEGTYEPEKYYKAVKGFEHEKEGGARCKICFQLRLSETANIAKQIGADYFTTTLSISPLKNAALLNEIGESESDRVQIPHLPSDFKKKGGYLRSIELSKKHHLYRQNFCGCVYSLEEAKTREKKFSSDIDSKS